MNIVVTHHNHRRAILFSDLHYSHETKDTCFKVLRFIKEKALKHNACVYFLGDFWDHVYRRGTLPVDLLNEMVRFLKKEWFSKTIMIPGNHDYYDSAEQEHGLEMFRGINNIEIFDRPTIRENALYLPYVKDHSTIPGYIEEAKEALKNQGRSLNCIFGHLDVVGARMNNSRTSTRGCNKNDFPVPTYSGHYHSPSLYGNVRYIGSSYQVHLGEAEDNKSLCMINYMTGELMKQIPINIGRRHYKMDFLLKDTLDRYNKGDRVVINKHADPKDVEMLEKRGVIVEQKKQPLIPQQEHTRLDFKNHDVVECFKMYIKHVDNLVHEDDVFTAFKEAMGQNHIKQMCDNNKLLREFPFINIEFDEMIMNNFGPFVGSHKHTFKTGVTLVTGSYKNKTGTDSNGVGKSLYTAGAFLWVCSGKTDPRCWATGITSSIISHGKKSAHIILHGRCNGIKFTITRCMNSGYRRSHELKFFMEDRDSGNNTINMTQLRINRCIFGVDDSNIFPHLLRNMVWTQMFSKGFITSGDKDSKREIGRLVNLDIWEALEKHCKNIISEKELLIMSKRNEKTITLKSKKENCSALLRIRDKMEEWHCDHQKTISDIEDEIEHIELTNQPPLNTDILSLKQEQNRLIKKKWEMRKMIDNPMVNYVPPEEFTKRWCQRESKNLFIQNQLKKVRVHGTKCDVCLSEVSAEQVEARKVALESELLSMDDLIKEQEMNESTYKDEMIKLATTQLNEIIEKETTIANQIDEAGEAWKRYCEHKNEVERMNKLKGRLEELKKKICPYDDKDIMKSILAYDEDIKKLDKEMTGLRKTKSNYQFLAVTLGRNGIQSYLLEKTMNRLCSLIASMTENYSFTVSHSNREKLIKQFNGHDISLMSGGELQRLKIASFLAYRYILNEVTQWSSNLLIFDEPDTFVDASGVKHMMQMIHKESKDKCVIVISHTNSMHRDMGMFDHHMVIERDTNGSRKRKRT